MLANRSLYMFFMMDVRAGEHSQFGAESHQTAFDLSVDQILRHEVCFHARWDSFRLTVSIPDS